MKSILFASTVTPSQPKIPSAIHAILRAMNAACFHPAAEGTLVSACCHFMNAAGRLEPGESDLGWMMTRGYADIARCRSFMLTRPAVSFCLAKKPKGGHYFLHVPSHAHADTPVLLLLHGFGGNLLYFPWAIWKEMPHCIIIAPSWQINWSEGGFEDRKQYLKEVLAHAQAQIGFHTQRPWLIPLSQGGEIAFQLAASQPEKFSGLLGISSLSDPEGIPRGFPIRLIHGDDDRRFPWEQACDTVISIQKSGGDAKFTLVRDANHFVLLSSRRKIGNFLKETV